MPVIDGAQTGVANIGISTGWTFPEESKVAMGQRWPGVRRLQAGLRGEELRSEETVDKTNSRNDTLL